MLLMLGVAVVLVTVLVPLPPMVMDFLLASNFALAMIIFMVINNLKSPLELSSFPSILLFITIFRLSLNVATTRLILGPGDHYRAGSLIYGISDLITSGGGEAVVSVIIGFIMFLIFVIVQFVVITKGSTRIAEVAARFTLDAMPGKQMAIDADLNAGLIDENQAKDRRESLSRHADFYGAMDGASKFVRGDAIASLIITGINLLGGLIIGIFVFDKPFTAALDEYARLSIGDGLVSQIPAIIISLAAGVLITRTDTKDNAGGEMIYQLFTRRGAIGAGGAMAILLGFVIPDLWFIILMGLGMLVWAYKMPDDDGREAAYKDRLSKGAGASAGKNAAGASAGASAARSGAAPSGGGGGPEDMGPQLKIDQIEIEVGYSLIPLVDASQGGDLLERIVMMRRQLAIELGLLVKPIRVRDNMQLPPNDYSIKLRDAEIAHGTALPDQFMAMDTGVVTEKVDGVQTMEPAFGLPAVWIPESLREAASLNGYTVVDATTVISTHLTEVVKNHAHEILSRQIVSEMLDKQKESTPAVVEEIGDRLRLSEIQAVLRNLLREKVSIRNMETILETLGDYADRIKDPEVLTEYVRARLGRAICLSLVDAENRLYCVTLEPRLEEVLMKAIEHTEGGSYLGLDPNAIERIQNACSTQLEKLVNAGHHPVVLCSAQVRFQLSTTLRSTMPAVTVISYNELVTSVAVESMGVIKTPGGLA